MIIRYVRSLTDVWASDTRVSEAQKSDHQSYPVGKWGLIIVICKILVFNCFWVDLKSTPTKFYKKSLGFEKSHEHLSFLSTHLLYLLITYLFNLILHKIKLWSPDIALHNELNANELTSISNKNEENQFIWRMCAAVTKEGQFIIIKMEHNIIKNKIPYILISYLNKGFNVLSYTTCMYGENKLLIQTKLCLFSMSLPKSYLFFTCTYISHWWEKVYLSLFLPFMQVVLMCVLHWLNK